MCRAHSILLTENPVELAFILVADELADPLHPIVGVDQIIKSVLQPDFSQDLGKGLAGLAMDQGGEVFGMVVKMLDR